MSFTVSIQVSTTATYRVQLSTAAAKGIGKDYVDPDEKWVDEADMALQTAFESIEGEVTELLANSLPKQLGIEVEMKPLKLKLDSNNIDSSLDCVEVES